MQVGLPHLPAQRNPRELALTHNLDQPGMFQFFEVVRKRGGCNRQILQQFSAGRAFIGRSELLENLVATWIGQRTADVVHLSICQLQATQTGHLAIVQKVNRSLLFATSRACQNDIVYKEGE